ncbi:MAG: LamG domain-containing protein [Coraliomargarita sp.]
MISAHLSAAEFDAYYTKVDSGEAFEKYSRTGPYADVIVRNIGKERGSLVFWRGSSYLPYWEVDGKKWFFEELTERTGDGPAKRPDQVNTYSVVRIVERSPQKVVVHWRYLPKFEGRNPHFNATNIPFHRDKIGDQEPEHLVDTRKFVDEYYTVRSDGSVTRRFKRGTEKTDAWEDPKNHLTQQLELTQKGIEVKTEIPAQTSHKPERVKGARVFDASVTAPVRWWRFDEGMGNATVESVTGTEYEIEGHRSYWKRGVSGTSLAFDGYTSVIRVPANEAPAITDAVTLEGWVALGAYPWNWTPVIEQGHAESYSMEIGPHGGVAMSVKVGSNVLRMESNRKLERKRWTHVAGTYDAASGMLSVFIDGELCGERKVAKGVLAQSGAPIQIGQGKIMPQSNPVRKNTYEDTFSFDGLIDEVRLYDQALTSEQIVASHQAFALKDAARTSPDLEKRVLPAGNQSGKFGATYTHLNFYDTWDGMFRFGDHPDVVVEFDQHPTSFVFWRGTCYIPMIVNEQGEWYSNEFNETWNRSGGRGCMEPMSDKESYSNHVKILENTPARCVVLWRYPLIDVLHNIANYNDATGWGDWSEWIYTIYPDGVAAKDMVCWTDGSHRHEWHESMVITGPDQHPEQVLETDPALRLITLDGEVRDYSWKDGPPKDVNYKDSRVHVVNYKGKYDPFTIAQITRGNVYSKEVSDYSVFPSWNHWPVGQMPSDGRYAKHPDRTAHSSLTHIFAPREIHSGLDVDKPYERMVMLEGMSTKSPAELITLSKSWLQAPPAKAQFGCEVLAYSRARREYPVVAHDQEMSFIVEASAEQPIDNLCVTVRNWGHKDSAKLLVNGKALPGMRQGTAVDTDGRDYLVVWLALQSTKPVEITISGARPADDYVVPNHLAAEAALAAKAQQKLAKKAVSTKSVVQAEVPEAEKAPMIEVANEKT